MSTFVPCGGLCLIVEDVANATSSTPATEVLLISPSQATASDTASVGTTPAPLASSASAGSTTVIDAYAICVGAATVSGTYVSPTAAMLELITERGLATDDLIAAISELAASAANAQDVAALTDAPMLLVSAAQLTSSVTASTYAERLEVSTARAESVFPVQGLYELLTEGASATDQVMLIRRVDAEVDESVVATGEAAGSNTPQMYLLVSTGGATSFTTIETTRNFTAFVEATGTSAAIFRNPDCRAFTMNVETTAGGLYDNFDFESAVQTPVGEFAVGPEGLYELTGATDDGAPIDAHVKTGFVDFGVEQTKRVDAVYFGYTSDGKLSVDVETYGSGHPPTTYYLEQRAASAPRNSRVQVGKGLSGRFWRFTIRNAQGADFDITSSTVDVAVSTRRV